MPKTVKTRPGTPRWPNKNWLESEASFTFADGTTLTLFSPPAQLEIKAVWTTPSKEEAPIDLSAPQTTNTPHLHPYYLISTKGIVQFQALVENIQAYLPYWLPSIWPNPIMQRGYCCGLVALEIALRYANPGKNLPPARKDGNKQLISLREIAKKNGYTDFGAIFDVEHLQKLAQKVGFSTCCSLRLNDQAYQDYINQICELLRRGNSLIVSCDLANESNFPGNSGGLRSHWALVFGFFYIENECQLLIAQFGSYFVWPAKNLYESNLFLPEHNPRSKDFYFYHKDKYSKNEFFRKISKDLPPEILATARFCTETSLNKFRFTLLATPTLALTHCIQLGFLFKDSSDSNGRDHTQLAVPKNAGFVPSLN